MSTMTPKLRHSYVTALVVVTALSSTTARAVDWPAVIGTEDGRADVPFQPFGFAQLLVESTPFAAPVTGLESPALKEHEGEIASFNIAEPAEFSLRRARIGLRGAMPGTDQRVTYFFAFESGMNPATRDRGAVLLDASVTISLIPGARVRIGQFKLPTMDEVLEPNPVTADFIFFSPIATQLLLEQPIVDGQLVGPGWSFRDVGAQVFDAFTFGDLEFAYAAMVSQGQMGQIAIDQTVDLSMRVEAAWLFSDDPKKRKGAFREELSVFAWRLQGPRTIDDAVVMRTRQGAGVHMRALQLRARAELVHAEGALFGGQNPAFESGSYALIPDGDAWGYTFDLAIEHLHPFELDFGVEELHRMPRDPRQARVFRNAVIGAQWHINKNARIQVNYEMRRLLVGPDAPPDAHRIASTMANVLATQLTFTF
jgi:hypothetical protein